MSLILEAVLEGDRPLKMIDPVMDLSADDALLQTFGHAAADRRSSFAF